MFAALTILYVSYRRSDGYRQRMVRQQIQTMMMGLSLLQNPWPFAHMILKLFERSLGPSEGPSENDRSALSTQDSHRTVNDMDAMQQPILNGEQDPAALNLALPNNILDPWEVAQWGDYQNPLGYFNQSFWDQFGSTVSPQPGF